MTRKSFLAATVTGLIVIGFGALWIPFASALNPNAKALANLPSVPIPPLPRNSFAYVDGLFNAKPWQYRILFVRRSNGHLDAWRVPLVNGRSMMPDPGWYNPGWLCSDFSPDFTTAEIYCRDPHLADDWRPELRWSLDGTALSPDIGARWPQPDMEPIQGSEILGDFVLYRPRSRN